MVRITGTKEHLRRLERAASPQMRAEVGKAIYAAADLIRVEAHRSIAHGAVQGKRHVPSLPGETPNWDTGQLATGIVTIRTGQLSADVEATAPHSLPLEFGTSIMAERPFMRPAAAKIKPQADALVEKAVNRVLRRR